MGKRCERVGEKYRKRSGDCEAARGGGWCVVEEVGVVRRAGGG